MSDLSIDDLLNNSNFLASDETSNVEPITKEKDPLVLKSKKKVSIVYSNKAPISDSSSNDHIEPENSLKLVECDLSAIEPDNSEEPDSVACKDDIPVEEAVMKPQMAPPISLDDLLAEVKEKPVKDITEFHPIANIFPMIQEGAFNELVEDIKVNGLVESIEVYENKILDGRNRFEACKVAGIKPSFKEYDGNDPLSYVISKNLKRRHLSESQRAVIASNISNMTKEDTQFKSGEIIEISGSANLPIHKISGSANLPIHKISQKTASDLLNIGDRIIRDVKKIEREAPDKIAEIMSGKKTVHEVKKELRTEEIKQERKKIADKAKSLPDTEKFCIELGDIRTYKTDKTFDFIITDPPYPYGLIDLYEFLAQRANEWLNPGGLLIAMCGQSYLDKIYKLMSEHMDYYWTACYHTPGQPTPLRQKNVNTTWKPLLMFTKKTDKYKGKIFGDFFVSDGNDKSLHKWGQSESGMYSIVSSICLPGQSIMDPFCGAGTTGVAALKHGCLFHGVDIDEECVKISKGRLYDSIS